MQIYKSLIVAIIATLSLIFGASAAFSAGQCKLGIDYALNGTSPADISGHAPSDLRIVKKGEYEGCAFPSAGCKIFYTSCGNGCSTGIQYCILSNSYESGVLKGEYSPGCSFYDPIPTGSIATADVVESIVTADLARWTQALGGSGTETLDHVECDVTSPTLTPQVQIPTNPEPKQSCSNGSSEGSNVQGSNIECRDGLVHQSLPITGTPYALNYSSRESLAGSAANRNFKIIIPTYNIPGYKFMKVTYTTTLAGRSYVKAYNLNGVETFRTDLDISQLVNWDGKDSAGNVVYGPVKATTTALFDMQRLDVAVGASFTTKYYPIFENNTDSNRFKMNGWTLSHYHKFEPSTSTVYAGFGLQIPVQNKTTAPAWYRDASNNYYIPSQDASEIYKFSSVGLHLQTLNADLNAPIFTFQHDTNNRLISITDRNGLITTLQRDASGNLTSITSPTGEVTSFTLDAASLIATIKDPLLNVTKFTYGTGTMAGLMLSYTNPRTYVKYYTYDTSGKLIQSKDYKGAIRTFGTTYDPNNDLGRSKTTVTSPLGRISTFYSQIDPNGATIFSNVLPDGRQTDSTTSADGLKTKVYIATTNETLEKEFLANPRFKDRLLPRTITATAFDGTQSVVTNTESYTLQTANNPLNILTKTQASTLVGLGDFITNFDKASLTYTSTTPSGRKLVTVVNAKGDPVKVTFGNLAPIQYNYDTRGRLSSVQQSTRTSTFTYDSKDLLATAKNALGETTSFAYDADRQIKTLTLPNTKTLGFVLDANGNPTKITVPSLQAYQNVFDKKDLYTSQSDPTIAGAAFTRSYLYSTEDELTQITHPDATLLNFNYNSYSGAMDHVTGPSIDRTYNYAGQNVTSISTNNGNDSIGITWSGSRPASITWTGRIAGLIEYTWSTFNRLASISVNSQKVADYIYTPEGELKTLNGLSFTRSATTGLVSATAVNNVKTSKTYNTFGELATESAALGSTTLYSITYTRDALGRISGISRTEAGATTNTAYTYDNLGQFLTETVGTTTTLNYTYDSNGNRLSVNGAETYDEQDRLVSDSQWTYVYNKNGYLSKKTNKANASTVTYAYDNLGNLLQVKNSTGSTIDYTIDGLGYRAIRKLNNAFTDGFLYQSDIKPTAQLNSNGSVKSYFIYGDHYNSPDLIIKGGVTYRVIHDQLGSPIFVINSSNNTVVQKIVYDVWGKVKSDSSPGFQPFGFAGGLYDVTTGLLRFGARDYDPTTGRWLNKDPIRFKGGWNFYSYVANDPINFIDVYGLSRIEFDGPSGLILIYPGSEGTYGPPQAFPAANNTTNPNASPNKTNGFGPAPDGTFSVGPFTPKSGGPNGSYGSGIFHIDIPERPGIGVHAGRENSGGVNHATHGCIRTNEDALDALRIDTPTTITIRH